MFRKTLRGISIQFLSIFVIIWAPGTYFCAPGTFVTLYLTLYHCICHIIFLKLHLSNFISRIAFVTFHLSHCICHIAFVTLHLSNYICHSADITLHLSHCTCYIALVTFHMPHCMCPICKMVFITLFLFIIFFASTYIVSPGPTSRNAVFRSESSSTTQLID